VPPFFVSIVHNYFMNDYSDHIAIIGAGISGLALGCTLKKAGVPCIIFERSSGISEYGAGISISPNGLRVLKYLNIDKQLKEKSGNPEKASLFSNGTKITSFPVEVVTTSRQTLYKVLLESYLSLSGEILFDHELSEIDLDTPTIHFSNKLSFTVMHIAACDGIKSFCRKQCIPLSGEALYSGYSVWRAIEERKQENIETHLGANFHIVTYPINENRTSFVAAIKTTQAHEESWKAKGSYEEMSSELPSQVEDIISSLKLNNDLFKWGVFTRPKAKNLYANNITFLGDAAHPIVPFIGQGGCLALEDAYTFGELVSKFQNDFDKIQPCYQSLRLKRVNRIQRASEIQGRLNHISNPVITFFRNWIMKYTPIIQYRLMWIWSYDLEKEIKKTN